MLKDFYLLRTQNELTSQRGDNNLIYPEIFKHCEVEAFFTDGGMGLKVQEVFKPSKALFMPVQRHTDTIVVLRKNTSLPPPDTVADAVISDREDVVTGVQSADCVPILVFDKARKVTASVHAGWRGTAQEILGGVLGRFFSEFKSDAADIVMALGPSIRSCCYEVGDEVIAAVSEATGEGDYVCIQSAGGKHIDLSTANKIQAVSLGVNPENIWISPECTCCVSRYHSYRRSQKQNIATTGRQGAFITISYGDALS
ncbi:MAG: peptidoglycan editing factor PgeF [Nitrospirae bacterium YQR-1]